MPNTCTGLVTQNRLGRPEGTSECVGFFSILTFKCAWPHSSAHIFRHLNFQKWSESVRILAVWIARVLCATAACTFAICQFPKVVRIPGVVSILTSISSSRQNGVQFFISQIARWFPFTLLWLLSPRLLHLSTWDNKLEIHGNSTSKNPSASHQL